MSIYSSFEPTISAHVDREQEICVRCAASPGSSRLILNSKSHKILTKKGWLEDVEFKEVVLQSGSKHDLCCRQNCRGRNVAHSVRTLMTRQTPGAVFRAPRAFGLSIPSICRCCTRPASPSLMPRSGV